MIVSVPLGSTVSILTVSESLFEWPALSETEQLTEWLPSPVTETWKGLEPPVTVAGLPSTVQLGAPAIPLVASETATETETGSFVFQPFEPLTAWVTLIVGLVWSSVIESV